MHALTIHTYYNRFNSLSTMTVDKGHEKLYESLLKRNELHMRNGCPKVIYNGMRYCGIKCTITK